MSFRFGYDIYSNYIILLLMSLNCINNKIQNWQNLRYETVHILCIGLVLFWSIEY